GRKYVRQNSQSGFRTWLGDGYEGEGSIPLPPCERVDESAGVDLAAEGLDVEALERRLHVSRTDSELETGTPTEPATDETGETTTASTGDEVEADESLASGEISSEAVASITSRLDAIETRLAGSTLAARVVDAGEGVTLLRLLDATRLEHGETVVVTVDDETRDTEAGDEA